MARTRYKIFDTAIPHFVTCTINCWLPIFTRREATDIILDSIRHSQNHRDLDLFAYVILENHLHLIVLAPELPQVLQSFKGFTAKQLLDLLRKRGAQTILRQLRASKLAHKKQSEYQVWQEGSKPKEIINDDMMWQKIEYIHDNPVERGYVDDPVHWRCSSARNYAKLPGLIDVLTDWET